MLRRAAHWAIRGYQLTLSSLVGRQCRHWPSCSDYADEAIRRHGLWPGGWIGLARICRCGPLGTHGIDLVPDTLAGEAGWATPWRYGRWRGVNAPPALVVCEAVEEPRRAWIGPEGVVPPGRHPQALPATTPHPSP